MKTSTPNLNSDLTGLSGALELADSILQSGGALHPNFHIEIHSDVLARYRAARAGKIFDPGHLDSLFENGVARRRGEFKMESVSLDFARDIYRVVSRLRETGDLVENDQLPQTPLKQIPPITVLNNIVRGWALDLGIPNSPQDDTAQIENLEAIANLVLHEAHPESQEMTTPRRRKLDIPMEEPLLIHSLGRIRDSDDQKENAEICDVSDLDFAITKSAVGAYITLVSQHGLAPSVEGLAELYRRGLLPLSILMKNDAVIEQIALITGREKSELCEAIAKVEETHSVRRAEKLDTLLYGYNKHLEATREQRDAKLAEQASRVKAPKNRPAVVTPPVRATRDEPNRNLAGQRAEIDALHLIKASAVLTEDSSWMVNHLLLDVLNHPDPILPNMDGFASNVSDLDMRFRVDLSPTNIWFTSAYLKGVHNNAALLTDKLGMPANITADIATDSITCFLIVGREVDIYVESILAHSALRSLIIQPNRGPEFVKAVKSFGHIIADLDRLHGNTIDSLKDILQFRSGICDTNRAWRKIAHNPLLNRDPEPGQVSMDLTDEEIRVASLIHHIPLPITKALFANTYVGMAWDQTPEMFEDRKMEVYALDRDGTVREVAESLRHSISTAGIETVHRGYPFKLTIRNPRGFADYVRPVSQRYDVISTGEIGQGLAD